MPTIKELGGDYGDYFDRLNEEKTTHNLACLRLSACNAQAGAARKQVKRLEKMDFEVSLKKKRARLESSPIELQTKQATIWWLQESFILPYPARGEVSEEQVMKRYLSWACALLLIISTTGAGLSSNATERVNEKAATARRGAVDEALSLLPPSDLIAEVNAGRFFHELLPRLAAILPGTTVTLIADLNEIISKTGVDLSGLKTAVIGGKAQAEGLKGSLVAIVQGLEIDPKRAEEAVKNEGGEFRSLEHQGQPIYLVALKPRGELNPEKADERSAKLAFASLGPQGTVLGDLAGVKSVLEAQADPSKRGSNAALIQALKEINTSGLIRFAADLPATARQGLSQMGDLFKQLAEVKMISGTLDLTSDLSASLEARLRTSSPNEATQLETNLRSLILFGKSLLGGNQNARLQTISQLLDQIKISTRSADVSVSILVPSSLLETLLRPEKKAAPANNATAKS